MIKEIVESLYEAAKNFPTDPKIIIPPNPRHVKEFTYKSHPLRVIFTLTLTKESGRELNIWMLSLCDRTYNPLPEKIVEELRDSFFDKNEPPTEMPDLLHPHKMVRKFAKLEIVNV